MVDFGLTAEDYRRHRLGFPRSLFTRLDAHGIGGPNERALDLGTGTGTVARSLAGQGGRVVGLDLSGALVEQARALDAQAGITIRYVLGHAENTGQPDESFDLVTAGQCWHWFDGPAAAREAMRVLVPGGHLAILHYDWIPLAGNVVAATEALILKYNPAWKMGGGTGLYPQWTVHVGEAGYEDIETFSYEEPATYSHEGWRGRIRASAGVGASLPPGLVAAFDQELAAMLKERFPESSLAVPHRVWALVCRRP